MKPTTPSQYLATLSEPRRTELKLLDAAIRKAAPKLKPYVAYSGTMIGYGEYHYKYASGREGDCPLVALSSRAQYISLYVSGHRDGKSIAEVAKPRLGKVSVGKACIRFKRLEDLNLSTVIELVRDAAILLENGSTDFLISNREKKRSSKIEVRRSTRLRNAPNQASEPPTTAVTPSAS